MCNIAADGEEQPEVNISIFMSSIPHYIVITYDFIKSFLFRYKLCLHYLRCINRQNAKLELSDLYSDSLYIEDHTIKHVDEHSIVTFLSYLMILVIASLTDDKRMV